MGLIPAVWTLNCDTWARTHEFSANDYLNIPSSLFTCAYDENSVTRSLFECHNRGISRAKPHELPMEYSAKFCTGSLVAQFLNRLERISYHCKSNEHWVEFSDGVESRLVGANRRITQHGRLLLENDDVFIPALWQSKPEIIAYSNDGYIRRTWMLPEDWPNVDSVVVCDVTSDGLTNERSVVVDTNQLELSLKPNQTVSVSISNH